VLAKVEKASGNDITLYNKGVILDVDVPRIVGQIIGGLAVLIMIVVGIRYFYKRFAAKK
jgi:hypothetical protein